MSGKKGFNDGPSSQSLFNNPTGICLDKKGNIFVVDYNNHCIRRISSEGEVSTIAGVAGKQGYCDGMKEQSMFSYPSGICMDKNGNLFVADCWNHVFRKISSNDGIVSLVAGIPMKEGSFDGEITKAQFRYPKGVVCDDDGNLFIVDSGNHTIRKISIFNGIVSTIAGIVGKSGHFDGKGK